MVNRSKGRDRDERRSGFVYKERDPKRMKERADRKGGNFDSIFKNGVNSWRPRVGDNQIRILPPTFKDAEHYGLDVFVHSYIGPDSSTYLCPRKMNGDNCPVCNAAAAAKKAGEEDDAKDLSFKQQTLVYILDRNGDEPEEPQVWAMSWTMDRDIAALCTDKKTGKVLNIDHPEKGFDVEFKRTGQKLQTRYVGIKIARDDSPILDDERDQKKALEFTQDNPLDEVLKFYDEEHLDKVLDGVTEKKADDDDSGDDRGGRRRSRDDDEKKDDDDRGSRSERVGRRSRDDDEKKDDDDRGSRRRGRDDDEKKDDDDRGGRRSRDDDEKKDDDDRGSRRGRDDDRKDDDDRGSRRGRDDDRKDDDDRGSRRGRDDDDKKEDDRDTRRRRPRDDDEKDPADDDKKDPEEDSRSSRRRGRDDDEKKDDDDRGSRRRGRDDDEKKDDDDRGSRSERVRRK